jgi:organic radical activating enzyme
MNYNKIKLYWKTLIFKRGFNLAIFLTYKCNLGCSYCILKIPTGNYPHSEISTLEQWMELINRWPVRIKEIYLSGREAVLHPQFVEITNWFLGKGYHIKVFSNLMDIDKFRQIIKIHRFMITATYHHNCDKNKFMSNYNELTKRFRIDVHELGYKILPFSKLMPLVYNSDLIPREYFRISPDRQIYIGCYDIIFNKSIK